MINDKILTDRQLGEIKRWLLANVTSEAMVAQAYGITLEQLKRIKNG